MAQISHVKIYTSQLCYQKQKCDCDRGETELLAKQVKRALTFARIWSTSAFRSWRLFFSLKASGCSRVAFWVIFSSFLWASETLFCEPFFSAQSTLGQLCFTHTKSVKKVIKNLIVRLSISTNRKTGRAEIDKSGQRHHLRQTTHFLVRKPKTPLN